MAVDRFTSRQRWVLAVTAAASFVAVMDGMVVTTALGAIRRDLSAPLSALHWTMTAYSLSFAALLIGRRGPWRSLRASLDFHLRPVSLCGVVDWLRDGNQHRMADRVARIARCRVGAARPSRHDPARSRGDSGSTPPCYGPVQRAHGSGRVVRTGYRRLARGRARLALGVLDQSATLCRHGGAGDTAPRSRRANRRSNRLGVALLTTAMTTRCDCQRPAH